MMTLIEAMKLGREILAELKAIRSDLSLIRQALALAPENADLTNVGGTLYRKGSR